MIKLIELILLYPALIGLISTVIFIVGLRGKEEYILPVGVRTVFKYLFCPWYGFKPQEATTVGYCTVFTVPNPSEDLLVHEATHRLQSLRESPGYPAISNPGTLAKIIGALIYFVKYTIEYIHHGYVNNKFEQEARKVAGQE